MFSSLVQKTGRSSPYAWIGFAACLVIACQFVAMVMVVDGQVHKAQLRTAHTAAQQLAVARCIQNNVGAVRQICRQQASGQDNAAVMTEQGDFVDPDQEGVNGLDGRSR